LATGAKLGTMMRSRLVRVARSGNCDVREKHPRVRIARDSVREQPDWSLLVLMFGVATECVYNPKQKPGLKVEPINTCAYAVADTGKARGC